MQSVLSNSLASQFIKLRSAYEYQVPLCDHVKTKLFILDRNH